MKEVKAFYRSAGLLVDEDNVVYEYMWFEERIIVKEQPPKPLFHTPFVAIYDLQTNHKYLFASKLSTGRHLSVQEIIIPVSEASKIRFFTYENDLAYAYPEYNHEYDGYSRMNWTFFGLVKPNKNYCRLNDRMFLNLKISEMSVVNGLLKAVCGTGSDAKVLYYEKLDGVYRSVGEEEVLQRQPSQAEKNESQKKIKRLPAGYVDAEDIFSNVQILKN